MIFGDIKILEMLKPKMKSLSKQFDKKIHLVKFTNKELIEVIE